MAKQRLLPLIMLDLSRTHGFGEVDFITCTDKDNGFIARVDLMSEPVEVDNINSAIRESNDLFALIKIVRLTGSNPSDTQLRALLKKAADTYVENTTKAIDMNNLTVRDYINFLSILAKDGKKNINDAGANYKDRQTAALSVEILESLINHLENEGKNR